MKKTPIILAFIGGIFTLICFYQIQCQLIANKEANKLLACEKSFNDFDYQVAEVCYADLIDMAPKKNCYRLKKAIVHLNANEAKEAKEELDYILQHEKRNKKLRAKATYLSKNITQYIDKIGANQTNQESGSETEKHIYDDYFIFQSPEIKWENPKKLTVYIDRHDKQYATYTKAFTMWEKAMGGLVRFALVNNDTAASITCASVSQPPIDAGYSAVSLTKPLGGYIWYANNMEEKYLRKMQIEIVNNKEKYPDLTDEKILSIALHEIGHALGVGWHSGQTSDVMYEDNQTKTPISTTISKRDINTVKKLYGIY